MTDQETPLPPPQPNDGSLNTVLPQEDTAVEPQPHLSLTDTARSKKALILGVLGIIVVAGLVYTVTSSPDFSSARPRNAGIGTQRSATVSPILTPQPGVEQELDSLELGDLETELKLLDRDVNALN